MNAKEITKELHAPFRKPTSFRKVITGGRDDIWSVDLVEMKFGRREEGKELSVSQKRNLLLNDGYKYIFMCIDCFTRYAWAVPMKEKTKESSWKAFYSILVESGREPNKIWADEGTEFYNSLWKKKLEELDILLYSTGNEKKAVIVERLNRIIKTWMYQCFTEQGNKKWIDILPQLMDRYNKRKHSSIGMSPATASIQSPKYLKRMMKYQYSDAVGEIGKPKYALGDSVRIARIKDQFEKGYEPNWSKEIFKIVKIGLNKPIMYEVADIDGESVGNYYESEIRKSRQSIDTYRKSVIVERPVEIYVEKVKSWRLDKKIKAKFNKYILTVELSDGTTEDVPLGKYIGIEKGGVFRVHKKKGDSGESSSYIVTYW